MTPEYLPAALMSIKASRWQLLCARLFGRRSVGHDGAHRVVIAEWRGKRYLLDWKEAARDE